MGYVVSAGCPDDNCPKILTDEVAGTVLVQGYVDTYPGVPAGEGVVRMSLGDLERLAIEHLNL